MSTDNTPADVRLYHVIENVLFDEDAPENLATLADRITDAVVAAGAHPNNLLTGEDDPDNTPAVDREALVYHVAKQVWDKGEAEYWDHESDRREFDPADPAEGYLDQTEDPRAMARDVLQQVREVVDAVFASGMLRDADEVRRDARHGIDEHGICQACEGSEPLIEQGRAEVRAAVEALADQWTVHNEDPTVAPMVVLQRHQLDAALFGSDGAALLKVKADDDHCCPECGYDGPHAATSPDASRSGNYECGWCGAEFDSEGEGEAEAGAARDEAAEEAP